MRIDEEIEAFRSAHIREALYVLLHALHENARESGRSSERSDGRRLLKLARRRRKATPLGRTACAVGSGESASLAASDLRHTRRARASDQRDSRPREPATLSRAGVALDPGAFANGIQTRALVAAKTVLVQKSGEKTAPTARRRRARPR
jgi:hypothetical protein